MYHTTIPLQSVNGLPQGAASGYNGTNMSLTNRTFKRLWGILGLVLVLALAPAGIARATCTAGQDSCSGSWAVSNATFNGGFQHACDTSSMCADQNAGTLGVGETCTLAYCAEPGYNTSLPSLQFVVNTSSVNVGVLSAGGPRVGTSTFTVESYLSSGYQVTTSSPGPVSGAHTLSLLGSPGSSTAGTEQFGINVVKNTCPAGAPSSGNGSCSGTLGADPSQQPDSTFSFGSAAHNSASDYYDTANKYMYKNGDIIALSSKSTGTTQYTISYLFNISNTTPAGTYTMNQSLVATATF